MNRTEHVDWVKERALGQLDAYTPASALASIWSDLRKHSDTADHPAIELGAMLMVAGHLSTEREVREWIEGIR